MAHLYDLIVQYPFLMIIRDQVFREPRPPSTACERPPISSYERCCVRGLLFIHLTASFPRLIVPAFFEKHTGAILCESDIVVRH